MAGPIHMDALDDNPDTTKRDMLLEVKDLEVQYPLGSAGTIKAVEDLSFDLHRGETLGIIGESGSGKSTVSRALIRLVGRPGYIAGGHICWKGKDLLAFSAEKMRDLRGKEIGLVFQDPTTSLNPLIPVGTQLLETVQRHLGFDGDDARRRVFETLELVGIHDREAVFSKYSCDYSAGFRQRVMIAMAIVCRPDLLIADEPTTVLGVTVQAQILRALKELQKELGMAMIVITHDFGVVSEVSDRILVMYAGLSMELAPKREFLLNPLHPYTVGLIGSVPLIEARKSSRLNAIAGFPPDMLRLPPGCPFSPRCGFVQAVCSSVMPPSLENNPGHWCACHFPVTPAGREAVEGLSLASQASEWHVERIAGERVVEVRDLHKAIPVRRGIVPRTVAEKRILSGISFTLEKGDIMGCVGESGSGKTALLHSLVGASGVTSGHVLIGGRDITQGSRGDRKAILNDISLILQDPSGSLDPRMTAQDVITEAMRIQGIGSAEERKRRAREMLRLVGLDQEMALRYPHQFSGGQRQRIGIARALAASPKVVLADEPVSALDVSLAAQVLNLLMDLRDRLDLTFLIVAHDMAVLRHMSTKLGVLYAGRFVELGLSDDVYGSPQHPYTRMLLAASPSIRRSLGGEVGMVVPRGESPDCGSLPSGCHFHPRCDFAVAACSVEDPPVKQLSPTHSVQCHVFPIAP